MCIYRYTHTECTLCCKTKVFSEIYIYTNTYLYRLEAKRHYIVLPSRSLSFLLEVGICQSITWPLVDLVLSGPYEDTPLIRTLLRTETQKDVRAQIH